MKMSTTDMAAEERLDAMLASGKISPDEYDRLRGAMRRESRTRPPEPRRRLAKSMADRQVFGVCAGLAKHLGVDPWIVRLLFVLGYFYTSGAFFFVYVILFWFLPWDESGAPSEFSIGYMIVLALVGAFAVVAGVHAGMMYEPFAASDRTIPAVSIMSRNILHFTSGLPHGQFVWVGLILVLSWVHSVSRPGSLMKRILGRWVPITLGVVIAVLLLATVFPQLTMVTW
jgi:phage shock protein PspC (stress-responsive transcriptional regulator)